MLYSVGIILMSFSKGTIKKMNINVDNCVSYRTIDYNNIVIILLDNDTMFAIWRQNPRRADANVW